MRFLHWRVELAEWQALIVRLNGNASNVFVFDDCDFRSFQQGGRFSYMGGFYTSSPAVIRPGFGTWNVVVVPPAGRVSASLEVS